MTARNAFFARLEDVELTLSDASVSDGALGDAVRNAKARMLRNGLAVVLFAILEDFIRQRTVEILRGVGATNVPFLSLPKKLQQAATTGILQTISFRLKLCEESQRLVFLQSEARKIASSGATPYELSQFSLMHSRSNLDKEDISDALSAFLVDGGWTAMTDLSARMNFGSLPLVDAFTAAASRRHSAAHETGTITPLQELVSFVVQARAIAATYDCLLSRAYWLLRARDVQFLEGKKFNASSCRISKVENVGGRWKLYVENRRKAVATSLVEAEISNRAHRDALASGDFVCWMDSSSRPIRWDCPGVI